MTIKKRGKIILLFFLAIVGCVGLLLFYTSEKKPTFQLKPRVSKIKTTKIEEGNDFYPMGWIRVQGTNIDMPIIRTDNRKAEFPVELESFSWSRNRDDKFHNRILILGHNIFNLSSRPELKSSEFSRFESLMSFVYYDFAKENQYIQLSLDGKEYVYKIFAVSFIREVDTFVFPESDDYSGEEMKKYISDLKKYSIYDYKIDVDKNDNVISLQTCTRFFGAKANYDFFVSGRLLRNDEKMSYSKVKKSDKYKKIEDVWESEGKNEGSYM